MPRNIFTILDELRDHPDCLAQVCFTTGDESPTVGSPSLDQWKKNRKWIEEAMCRAGFEAAEELAD